MTENTTHCAGRNGTYNCERAPHSADVRHRKTFRHCGRTMIARWSEAYGPVKFTARRA